MVRRESVYFGVRQGGVDTFYFDQQETERIAYMSGEVQVVTGIMTGLVDGMTMGVVSASAGILSRKARRCLSRGKCLKIELYGLIVVPREYEPD
jgi:hypothetical protein